VEREESEGVMVVGVCQLDVRIPENHSLKGKRHVLRKLTERVRNRFNVAISEVGDNDLWQRAQIGICTVSNDRRHINSSLDKVVDYIENMYLVEVLSTEMEILSL
jgi:uncharacterized protein YlxP (DUF503 family)